MWPPLQTTSYEDIIKGAFEREGDDPYSWTTFITMIENCGAVTMLDNGYMDHCNTKFIAVISRVQLLKVAHDNSFLLQSSFITAVAIIIIIIKSSKKNVSPAR